MTKDADQCDQIQCFYDYYVKIYLFKTMALLDDGLVNIELGSTVHTITPCSHPTAISEAEYGLQLNEETWPCALHFRVEMKDASEQYTLTLSSDEAMAIFVVCGCHAIHLIGVFPQLLVRE